MSTDSTVLTHTPVKQWKVIDAIGVGLLLEVCIFFCLFVWIDAGTRVFPSGTEFQRSQVLALVSAAVILAVIAPLVVLISKLRSLGPFLTSIGWNPSRHLRLSAVVGFGSAIAVTLAMSGRVRLVAPTPFTLVIIAAVLGQAFIEECYFRGVLFVALSGKIGEYLAIVAATVLFAYWHPMHRLTVLPIAVVLGIARLRTKSVADCFVLHVFYNLGLFLLTGVLA